ncbi:MAG: hypothetical protein EBZ47_02935 [Chlamydiae bacterium]|nr:hypothetical protein [Chlamydiota bacterium]
MKAVLLLIICTPCLSFAEESYSSEPCDELIAEEHVDFYDRTYSYNPVPIHPNAPQPKSWKEAYLQMQCALEQTNKRLEELALKIKSLESEKSSLD